MCVGGCNTTCRCVTCGARSWSEGRLGQRMCSVDCRVWLGEDVGCGVWLGDTGEWPPVMWLFPAQPHLKRGGSRVGRKCLLSVSLCRKGLCGIAYGADVPQHSLGILEDQDSSLHFISSWCWGQG